MKMERKLKLDYKIGLSLTAILFLLTGCSSSNFEKRYFAFSTTISVKYECSRNLPDVFGYKFNFLSDLFDTYRSVPEIINAYTINNSNDYLTVEDDLYSILDLADYYFNETDGVFNPLVKDVAQLWKNSINNNEFPNTSELENLVEKMEYSSLDFILPNKVKIDGEAKIDLGAIAKGYALEKIKPYFIENNIKNYIVNAGNSSIILGENNSNNGFYRVGINNTDSKYLELKNISIGTSSIYEQKYLEKDGEIYSHIVNGLTGSAKIINHMVIALSNDAVISDVYSTVGMISSIQKLQEIEKRVDVKFVAFKNGEVVYANPNIKVLDR